MADFSHDAVQALKNLTPNAQFTLVGNSYDGLEWLDTSITKPTEAQIEAECAKLKTEYDALQYSRDRERAYNRADLFDHALLIALWEKVMESDSTAADALQVLRNKVKTDNPKPS
tara:strand:- start:2398 stop:2742 length:345 start_codon:yes stop_codon:yes gene_type:complete